MSTASIRRAQPADSRAIADIHVAAWREAYAGLLPEAVLADLSVDQRERQWRQALERVPPLTDVFVAEAESGGMVGFVACGRRRGDRLNQDGEVYAIYVLRSIQRNGIGRALCGHAAAALLARNCRSAGVWVLESNQPARAFYERLGAVAVTQQTIAMEGISMIERGYAWPNLDAMAHITAARGA